MLRALAALLTSVLALVAAPVVSHAALVEAPGASAPSGPGTPVRYSVEVERGIGEQPAVVAREIERRMADHRGWGAGHRRTFQRVRRGRHDVRIVLVSAATTNRMCAPLRVLGYWNCYQGGVVVLNHDRWLRPAPTYGSRVDEYRTLMVMHEFGHALGMGHAGCWRARSLASPMMQQGMGLRGCRRNPWPEPQARRPPARCSLTVTRVRDTRVLRVGGQALDVGTPVELRLFERVSGRWQRRRATATPSTARTSWLLRSDAAFLRMTMPGTVARRACSAVAAVTPRST